MGNSRVQTAVEDWVRRTWMQEKFGQRFVRERLALDAGGEFEFDAVNLDNRIAASISASGGVTASGKKALPKLHKIRADCLFLLMADLDRRLIICADSQLHDLCLEEISKGRMPRGVEFLHAELPPDLMERLKHARADQADEVTPA